MGTLFDLFTNTVVAVAATASAHFGVSVEGLEVKAPAEPPAVQRTVPVKPAPAKRQAVAARADCPENLLRHA